MSDSVGYIEPIYITHPFRLPSYVYRIYAEDGLLLYVGSTRNLPNRLEQHSHAKWFRLAYKVELDEYASEVEARSAERAAIRDECPAANVVWTDRNSGRGASGLDPRIAERLLAIG